MGKLAPEQPQPTIASLTTHLARIVVRAESRNLQNTKMLIVKTVIETTFLLKIAYTACVHKAEMFFASCLEGMTCQTAKAESCIGILRPWHAL